MGGRDFEVALLNEASQKKQSRIWTRSQLDNDENIKWLKRENARGEHIYIRPAGETSLVLVDAVADDDLARMKVDGIAPALFIETAPGRGQAWVKTAAAPRPREELKTIAIYLEDRYSREHGRADADGYGLLAGFDNGGFVMVREASGLIVANAQRLVERAHEHADQLAARQRVERRVEDLLTRPDGTDLSNPIVAYERLAKLHLTRSKDIDLKRMDVQIARAMIEGGAFWDHQIAGAMKLSSPSIGDRQAPEVDAYIERTMAAAWDRSQVPPGTREQRAAELQASIDAEAEERDRVRGPEL